MSTNDDANTRKRILAETRQVVVKAGTRLLTDLERIPLLVSQIARMRNRGLRVLLVTSGAVGIGMKTMGIRKRPSKLPEIQALAAIGQAKLMTLYEKAAEPHGFHVAQILLTATGLRDRERHLNALNCIHALWNQGVLPIVNENDTVSVDELKFGDNDILAGLLATMTRSQLTIILTMVDGLRDRNPDGSLGKRIPVVERIDATITGKASGTDNRELSIGGMQSKLAAAEIVNAAGDALWIADGQDPEILDKIIEGADVGTLFLPCGKKSMEARKRWIKFFSRRTGKIWIDPGAATAIASGGRSLLPSGITKIEGEFRRGDTIEIVTAEGQVIARGLTNYAAEDIRRIAGCQSADIPKILGFVTDEAVIHRNNLVLVRRTAKTL
jgi:glutamate 5-kinase